MTDEDLTPQLTSLATDAAIVRDLAMTIAEPDPIDPDDPGVLVVPPGARVVLVDEEVLGYTPARPRGTTVLHEAESFATFVLRHQTDATQLYVDTQQAKFTAVLNDHTGAEAGWRDFRAELSLQRTVEWKAILEHDQKWMAQETLAEFLENHRPFVEQPPAADLLELVQTFQASRGGDFKRAVRLDNGDVQLVWSEETTAQGGRGGELTIPEKILWQVAPFEGTEPLLVESFFRYQIRDGHLRLSYALIRPDELERRIVNEIIDEVEQNLGMTFLRGGSPIAVTARASREVSA